MVGGVIVVGENKGAGPDQIAFLQNSVGAHCGTVRQFSGAARIENPGAADGTALLERLGKSRAWLEDQSQVKSVHYPGLKTHPQPICAPAQMRGFGGIVTIILKTDLEGTRRFLENTHLLPWPKSWAFGSRA